MNGIQVELPCFPYLGSYHLEIVLYILHYTRIYHATNSILGTRILGFKFYCRVYTSTVSYCGLSFRA